MITEDEKEDTGIGFRYGPIKKAALQKRFANYAAGIKRKWSIKIKVSDFYIELTDEFTRMMDEGRPPDWPPRLVHTPAAPEQQKPKQRRPKK